MADTTTSNTGSTAPTVVTVVTPSKRRPSAAELRAQRRRLGVPEVDTRPRPLRQALWILASATLVMLVLLGSGNRIGQTGATATKGIEAARLLELADPDARPPTTVPTAPDSPAAPAAQSEESSTSMYPDPAAPMATATTVTRSDEQAVGGAALDQISYPWEELLPGWTIEFLPAQDGLYGLTLVPERRIEIYVRPDEAPGMVAHVIAHEIGHAVDVTLNDGSDRRRWTASRGLDDAPWWPDSGATDFSTGAGDFAEAFAAWQVGPSGFRSALAPAPDGPQIELLAELSSN